MDSLYQENILDHFRNPRNSGKLLVPPAVEIQAENPSCGDSLTVFVEVEKGKIEKIKFLGSGCAISVASMSMLSEKILGMKIDQVGKISYEEVEKMLGVPISSARKKCAYLGLEAVKKPWNKI